MYFDMFVYIILSDGQSKRPKHKKNGKKLYKFVVICELSMPFGLQKYWIDCIWNSQVTYVILRTNIG